MTAEQHARDDAACIFLMAITSWRSPRDYLRDCGYCGAPFWVHGRERYCSERHRVAQHRATHLEAERARDRDRHARERATRRAA